MTKRRGTKGAGSVYRETSSGKWVAQTRTTDPLTGQTRTRRRRRDTRDAARAALAELQATPTIPRRDADWTLAAWLAHWRATTLPGLDLAPTTRATYETQLRVHGEPTAGVVLLSDFGPAEARLWASRLAERTSAHGRPVSASSVRQTIMAARRALKDAHTIGLLPANPLATLTPPAQTPAGDATAPTSSDDVDRIISACRGNPRLAAMTRFVADTGCRRGEMLGLQWADVDLDAHTATLRRGGSRGGNKGGKARTVTLTPAALDALRDTRRRQAEQRLAAGQEWADLGLVFATDTGRPIDPRNANRMIEQARRDAGVPTDDPWHSLRHGLAHRLIKAGVPMPMIAAMLGHSSISITVDTYGHIEPAIPADLLEAALTVTSDVALK